MAVLGLSAGMEERARSLHQRALIFDACFSTPGFFKDEDAEIQAFLDGGIGGGLATVAEEEHNFVKAVDSINKHMWLFTRHPGKVRVCQSVGELEQCKAEGTVGFVWHFQDTRPIETDLDYLEVFPVSDLSQSPFPPTLPRDWSALPCSDRNQTRDVQLGKLAPA
jgi:microsomal dipeptidase-like Zn-dependent dipeptidase